MKIRLLGSLQVSAHSPQPSAGDATEDEIRRIPVPGSAALDVLVLHVGGISDLGATISLIALAGLTKRDDLIFRLTRIATMCVSAGHAVWLVFVSPRECADGGGDLRSTSGKSARLYSQCCLTARGFPSKRASVGSRTDDIAS